MTELTQQRKEFEAWRKSRGFTVGPYPHFDSDEELLEWEGWQGGRSSLESENAELRELGRELAEAAAGLLSYREHLRLCQVDKTDFCTCGLKEAVDSLKNSGGAMLGAIRGGTNV